MIVRKKQNKNTCFNPFDDYDQQLMDYICSTIEDNNILTEFAISNQTLSEAKAIEICNLFNSINLYSKVLRYFIQDEYIVFTTTPS